MPYNGFYIALHARGINEEELSGLLGVTKATVMKYGRTLDIPEKRKEQIASILNVPKEKLTRLSDEEGFEFKKTLRKFGCKYCHPMTGSNVPFLGLSIDMKGCSLKSATVRVEDNKAKLFIANEYRVWDVQWSAEIKFCPMCGRKLKEVSE